MNDEHGAPRGVRIAYRGRSGEYGDNDVAGFAAAIEAGDGVHADVRMTSDGVVVLTHQEQGGGLPVERLTWERLHALDGDIVRLRWLLDRCAGRDVLLVLQVAYRGVIRRPGQIAHAVLEQLHESGRTGLHPEGLTVVTSSSPACLVAFNELNARLPLLQVLAPLRSDPEQALAVAGRILDLVDGNVTGIVPAVTDLRHLPWWQLAHPRALGVFPYPPSSVDTSAAHLEAVDVTVRAGCEGGHFRFPEMYQETRGPDPVSGATAMREFLVAREIATAVGSQRGRRGATVGALAGQLVLHGDGAELAITDIHDAAAYADTLPPTEATELRGLCAQLIVDRTPH
jgi:glycerophosphoryl diester phosphodiesterase